MDLNDIKLFTINTATLAISFSAVEDALKIILLIVSIVYTVQKSYELYKKRKGD